MDKHIFINELKKLIDKIKAKGFDVQGCGKSHVAQIENHYGKLPALYKEYLYLMGADAGDFKKGTDISADGIDDINESTIELMQENNIIRPKNMFAFLLHQGYSALFFIDRCDNPAVYCYTEGECIKKVENSFSEYIFHEIEFYGKYQ